MNLLLINLAAALALVQGSATDNSAQSPDTTAAAIVADCGARKFETSVEIEKDGQKRLTKLKLCSAKEADQASWVRTLQDAKAKIAAHPDISQESKAKIAAELDAEIAKSLSGTDAVKSAPAVPAPLTAQQPEQAVLPAPQSTPPISAPPKMATSTAKSLSKPSLSIRCLDAGEDGEGNPCMVLEKDTRLSVHADEDISSGTVLRFLRRGDMRGEVALAAMRQGQSIRYKLPERLCLGVSSSKVEIQILRSNQLVETLGPYRLRC
ncbi:hypothetical protein LVY65_10280 [Sphingomonas sp. G124]|uniref:PH domain-containing protein n=1 Tax=Sphingomonas cremea TaxID=2904799 RepID=A0A9X1QNS4_9SPHN|nr:hypothetical protein [Sphingomonas cremea]MCF2515447.1 hypothetical protein [Sphingomonas cremea]